MNSPRRTSSEAIASTAAAARLRLMKCWAHFGLMPIILFRRFFGTPPVHEAIDFSRYAKGKHLYVELKRKAESDATWRSLGEPAPEF